MTKKKNESKETINFSDLNWKKYFYKINPGYEKLWKKKLGILVKKQNYSYFNY